MKYLLLIFLLCSLEPVFSQAKTEKRLYEKLESGPGPDARYSSKPPEPVIYDSVSEPAQFPGGNAAMMKYLVKHIHYPEIAVELGIPSSRQAVLFVVSDMGSISNVQMKRPNTDCPECDQEVIRAVKSMPGWIPGKIDGKAVNSWYLLSVTICMR